MIYDQLWPIKDLDVYLRKWWFVGDTYTTPVIISRTTQTVIM